jgi:hypothetical protein
MSNPFIINGFLVFSFPCRNLAIGGCGAVKGG